jgi:hypothetical protein
LYLAPGHISLRAVQDLHLLTAAYSQVRFDVGAKIFILKFSWRIRGCPPIMVFPRHDVVFILYSLLLFSQDGSHLDGSIFEAGIALV